MSVVNKSLIVSLIMFIIIIINIFWQNPLAIKISESEICLISFYHNLFILLLLIHLVMV